MATQVELSEADLRSAWRQCALVGTTFEASMQHPALAIAVRRIAESNVRRQQRLAEQQRFDHKRAQANDLFSHE